MKKHLWLFAVVCSAWSIWAQAYDYCIITNDEKDAGTNAKITLVFYCGGGNYTQLVSGGINQGSWTRGWVFTGFAGGGAIDSIRISHDNSGSSPDWKLAAFAVKSRTGGAVSVFQYDNWLADNRGSGCATSVVLHRSAFGWKVFSAPFAESYTEKNAVPPVTAKGVAHANKNTGNVSFYCDASVGGANATAEVGPGFSAPSAGKVYARTEIVYTGGLVNAFLASFSELNFIRHINGTRASPVTMQPAFTGQTIFDKVIGIASVMTGLGALGSGTVADVIEAVSTCNDMVGLINGMESLASAGKATTYTRAFSFDAKSGYNKCTVGLMGVTTAMATGSSIGVVCGVVKSVEVIGGVPVSESAPPPPSVELAPSGMPAAGSGMSPHTIKPK